MLKQTAITVESVLSNECDELIAAIRAHLRSGLQYKPNARGAGGDWTLNGELGNVTFVELDATDWLGLPREVDGDIELHCTLIDWTAKIAGCWWEEGRLKAKWEVVTNL